jgi:hypothetical protein
MIIIVFGSGDMAKMPVWFKGYVVGPLNLLIVTLRLYTKLAS